MHQKDITRKQARKYLTEHFMFLGLSDKGSASSDSVGRFSRNIPCIIPHIHKKDSSSCQSEETKEQTRKFGSWPAETTWQDIREYLMIKA